MPNNNNTSWQTAAIGAASGAVGMGVQRLGVNYDYRKQREQQNKLTEMQLMAESRLMDIQNQKQYEMWLKTGPQAQKEQYEKAGLNSALMYGMSGGGGQTVGGGMPNISTSTAPDPNTRTKGGMDIAGAMQLQLLNAQKENIEADTANKKAEVPVKGAQVPNIEADTENKIRQKGVYEAQAQNIAEDTIKKVQEVQQLEIQNKINKASADDQIKQIKYESIGALLNNYLTSAKTTNTQQDTKLKQEQIPLIQRQLVNMVQENMREWDKMNFQERMVRVQEKLAEWNTDADKFTVEQITKLISVGAFTDAMAIPQQGYKPVTGFGKNK